MTKKKGTDTSTTDPDTDAPEGEGQGPEQAAEAAQASKAITVVLKNDHELFKDGVRYKLKTGERLSSRDYDLNQMFRRGARMDVLDDDGVTVLLDFSELAE